MIPKVAAQLGLAIDDDANLSAVARSERATGMSGRDVAVLLERAHLYSPNSDRAVLSQDALELAVETSPPRDRAVDRFWSLLALEFVTDERLLPWMTIDGFDPDRVHTLVEDVVRDDGSLDRVELSTLVRAYEARYGH
jgi:hypothetical protein